jgi:hypothetical protein
MDHWIKESMRIERIEEEGEKCRKERKENSLET